MNHWATGDLEAALRAMQVWIDTMQRLGNHTFAIASAFAVADMHVSMGHLGEAEQALRQAIQQAAALGRETEAVTTHQHLGLALLAQYCLLPLIMTKNLILHPSSLILWSSH